MIRYIVLDSTPLGLLAQRPGATEADACRQWLANQTAKGLRAVVPEIIDYEVRRELIRAGKSTSVTRLDRFLTSPPVDYVPITTGAMRLAADLWAKARRQGTPTSHPHALDVDVILSAQVLAAGMHPTDFIVATGNVAHLSRFVPAALWSNI
jgi:hypothetical protein